MICPLCQNSDIYEFAKVIHSRQRSYLRCQDCDLIFCDPKDILDQSEEKIRYASHQNDIKSSGYVAFLSDLLLPVIQRCNLDAKGLDFGSGPYPMMSEVAHDRGYELDNYDPYFAPNEFVFDKKYDFILCCEVAEHFNNPMESLKTMLSLLKVGGILGIKTSLFKDDLDFSKWHYVQDETHISIYTHKTMEWVAKAMNLEIQFQKSNVTVFKKITEI